MPVYLPRGVDSGCRGSLPESCFRRHHHHRQMRRMLAIVIHRLGSLPQARLIHYRRASVGVAIEAREIAARSLEADRVAFLEDITGDARVSHDPIDLARPGKLRLLEGIAIAQSQDAVG